MGSVCGSAWASAPARPLAAAAAVLLSLVVGGCARTRIEPAYRAHERGAFRLAAEQLAATEPRVDDRGVVTARPYPAQDELWVSLERGKILQDAGLFAESARAFAVAEGILRAQDYLPEFEVADAANNVGAILTDETQRRYEATFYDTILIETAQALNMAMLGDLDAAAVYARRQIDRQEEQVERRAALDTALDRYNGLLNERGASLSRGPASVGAIESSPAFAEQRARLAAVSDGGGATAEALVPFGYWLGSVIMRASGRPGEAADFAKRLASFRPGFPLNGSAAEPALDPGTVYVVFENGLAPARAPVVERSILGLGLALPVLEFRDRSRAGRLRLIGDGGRSGETLRLGSLDEAVAIDFDERMGLIWGRPILSLALKIAATEVGARAAGDRESLARLAVRLAGYYWALSAEPDLRSWRALPGEHLVAEVPRPASGRLVLDTVGGPGREAGEVLLPPGGGPVLLFVRSTAAGNLVAYAAPLDPGRVGPR